jgi:predicted ATPase
MPRTSFIGREREIAVVIELLECTRLLTLTGVGGSGKRGWPLRPRERPRMRIRTVWRWCCWPPVADPNLVATTIARGLGIREIAGQRSADSLVTYLRGRRLLLILDNFEHLLDAAPLVSDLLDACPQLSVLATSRESLRLRDERELACRRSSCPRWTATSRLPC